MTVRLRVKEFLEKHDLTRFGSFDEYDEYEDDYIQSIPDIDHYRIPDNYYEYKDYNQDILIMQNSSYKLNGSVQIVVYIEDNGGHGYIKDNPTLDLKTAHLLKPLDAAYLTVFLDCSDEFVRNCPSVHAVFSNRNNDFSGYSNYVATNEFTLNKSRVADVDGNFDSDVLSRFKINQFNGIIKVVGNHVIEVDNFQGRIKSDNSDYRLTIRGRKAEIRDPCHTDVEELTVYGNVDFTAEDSSKTDLTIYSGFQGINEEYYEVNSRWKSIYKRYIRTQGELENLEQFTDHIKVDNIIVLNNEYQPQSPTITVKCALLNSKLLEGRETVHIYSFTNGFAPEKMNVHVSHISALELDVLCLYASSIFMKSHKTPNYQPRYIHQVTDTNIDCLKRPIFDRFYAEPLQQGLSTVSEDFESGLIGLIFEFLF